MLVYQNNEYRERVAKYIADKFGDNTEQYDKFRDMFREFFYTFPSDLTIGEIISSVQIAGDIVYSLKEEKIRKEVEAEETETEEIGKDIWAEDQNWKPEEWTEEQIREKDFLTNLTAMGLS